MTDSTSFLCRAQVLFVAAGLLGLSPTVTGQDALPVFPRIAPYEDEFGSGGFVELVMSAPADSVIQLQTSESPATPRWVDVGEPVISAGLPVTMAVPTHEGEETKAVPYRFYRFSVTPYDIVVTDDGKATVLKVGQAAPTGVVLASLRRQLGSDVFPTEPYDPWRPWEPGEMEGVEIGEALASRGFRVWTTPPEKDDPALPERWSGIERFQERELPDDPADIGRGKIEDGFEGIPNFPRPEAFTLEPPEPGSTSDKVFRVEVPDPEKELPQEINPNFVEPGRHLRAALEVKADGGVAIVEAALVAGDAWRLDPLLVETPHWPKHPSVGSLVWVVRSPVADRERFLNQIYFIGALDNPFEIRSYDPPPPYRGSHGSEEQPAADVRVPIPVLEKDTALQGMTIEFFRYMGPAEIEVLDPETFAKHQDSFKSIGRTTGDDLVKVARETEPRRTGGGASLAAGLPAPTVTQLFRSGPRASKFNFVVIGDGFANTAADQNAFNNYVENTVMQDLLSRDVHREILNGINIFRVNTFSAQSGITTVNTNGAVVTTRNTALQYRYSGVWNRCWMEPGPNTIALMNGIINGLVPEVDGIAVVLNVSTGGGCARGTHFAVTLASGWGTFAHEFGHFFASQQDEYQCNQGAAGCGSYAGAELTEVNQTRVTVRNQIKWNVWIPPTRPVPTAQANVANTDQDVGLFPGATRGNQQWWNGIFRPSWRGRMNNNTPPHNPVGYTAVRETARGFQEGDFRKSVVGDFDGDGRTDLVILDDRQLSLYLARDRTVGPNDPVTGTPPRAVTGVLEPTWYHTDLLRNAAATRSWEFRRNDILIPGDFDGDGRTDLYVINLVDWNQPYLCLLRSTGTGFEPVRRYDRDLPGWGEMRRNDQFYAGDFSGDGRDDLMVFNGRDWNMPYFLMLRSTGTQLVYSRRYDRYLPGWEMGRNERFHVGDYNGDGRMGVIAHNTQDWNQVHLMIFNSTGSALSLADRYYGTIQQGNSLFWTMRRQDELIPVNFNGDRTKDLAIFNGRDWGPEYLALFACNEAGRLQFRRRYEDTIPGWNMRRRDRFYAADVNGDGNEDLVVFNAVNWSTQYLGILRSNGENALQGTWQSGWIGGWNLGSVDNFHVAEFRGTGGWTDLFVYNQGWFGLLRSHSNRYALEAIYRRWIHNHRYHGFGFW